MKFSLQKFTGRSSASWLVFLCALALSCAGPCVGQTPNSGDFIATSTAGKFQAAVRAGIKHILITEHLDMTQSPTEPDADNAAQALDNAVARVRETTVSIGGRCSTPPPASFNLTEAVPPGACAILVEQDFLDVPVGTLKFWLDSIYVAVRSPGTYESSVLVLHVDGLMWITDCVFQGAGNNSRAIDVTTKDEGFPSMFVRGSTISSFTRPLAPGIVVWHNASLTLENVFFRNNSLTPSVKNDIRRSPAVTAFEGAGLLMQDVTFEDNFVFGQPAEFRAVSIGEGPPPAVAYATPPFFVWLEPSGPKVLTQSAINSTSAGVFFLDGGAQLSGIQAERQAHIDETLGPLPLAPTPAPAPTPTSAPTPTLAPAPAAASPAPPSAPPTPPPPPPPRPPPIHLPLPPMEPDSQPREDENRSDLNSEATEDGPGSTAAGEQDEEGGDDDDDDGVRVGLVVACAIAAAVAAALCVTAAVLAVLRRRRRQLQEDEPPQAPLQEPSAAVGNWPYTEINGQSMPAKEGAAV